MQRVITLGAGDGKRARVSSSGRTSQRVPRPVSHSKTKASFDSVGFPKQLKMVHRYCDTVPLQAVGALATYKFSCNGMYDPDITSTGHQPYYFDQLTAVYNHYTVIGSKIKVTVVPAGTFGSPCDVVLSKNDDSTAHTAMSTARERSEAVSTIINPNNPQVVVLKSKWSAKGTFGGSVLGNDALQGTSSANPTEQTQYHLQIYPSDATTTLLVYCQVEIEYIAVWDELKDTSSS